MKTITYADFKKSLETIKKYQEQEKELKQNKYYHFKKNEFLGDACSVRLFNVLRIYYDLDFESTKLLTIKSLKNISISNFLNVRNCGKKATEELRLICYHSNIKLKN